MSSLGNPSWNFTGVPDHRALARGSNPAFRPHILIGDLEAKGGARAERASPRLQIREIGPNIDVKTTLRLCFTDDIFVWQRGAAGEPVAPQGCPETPPADISSPRTSFGDPVQEEIAPLDWWPERHRLQRTRNRAEPWNLLSSTGRSPPLVPWLYPSVRTFGAIALN